MKTLGEYVFLRKTSLNSTTSAGIQVSGAEDEPVGELVSGPDSVKKGIYAYDPAHTIQITLKGETYQVTKAEYLLATNL